MNKRIKYCAVLWRQTLTFFCSFLFVIGVIFPNKVFAQSKNSQVKNLGPQIRLMGISAGNVGYEANGDPVLYVIVRGRPVQFNVVDVKTGKITKHFSIKGLYDSTNGAVAVAPDGTVYIGTRGNGHIYQYTPGSDKLVNLSQPVPHQNVVFRLINGKNGIIYGSTYPGGNFFKYDPDTKKFTDYGQAAKDERYGRSIGYDPKTNKLFIGTGVSAKLIEYDLDTGKKKDITNIFADKGHSSKVFNIKVVSGRLFVVLNKGGGSYVINIDDIGSKIAEKISFVNFPSDPIPGDTTKVLINTDNTLASFDLITHETKKLTKSVGDVLPGKFVKLDESGFPGYTYVAPLYGHAKMLKYNLQTGKTKTMAIELNGAPTKLSTIHRGPDGKMYIGGMKNGLGIYSPESGKQIDHLGIGQIEGISSLGNKIYFGNYTSARILEYDPSLPWNLDDSSKVQNPKQIYSIERGQDRPFAMLGVEKENKLFIGTVPTYGEHNGAFTIYDAKTQKFDVHKGIVDNQSIVALAYDDGKVYGGSNIYGGLGKSPIAKEAKLFIWDTQQGKKIYETVPVAGKTAVTSLINGAEGKIWGLADGTLFIFDPDTRKVTYTKELTDKKGLLHWMNGYLCAGTDGDIYSTVGGSLFKINPDTKKVTKLLDKNIVFLARDDYGNLYFRAPNNIDLLQYNYSD